MELRGAGARTILAHGLASGMLSGIVSRLLLMALLYPLDTLRVRVQARSLPLSSASSQLAPLIREGAPQAGGSAAPRRGAAGIRDAYAGSLATM